MAQMTDLSPSEFALLGARGYARRRFGGAAVATLRPTRARQVGRSVSAKRASKPSAPVRKAVADFEAPHVAISRVYTRTGDSGSTGLVGGQRVPKDDIRIEAYGTVDELNSWIGLCRAAALDEPAGTAPADPTSREQRTELAVLLLKVQHELFNLGSILATKTADVGPRQPRVRPKDIEALEADMDRRTAGLPPLRSFVLPGGSRFNALLHLARTVCRRAERLAVRLQREEGGIELEVRYLNRLSDALFVWSRDASRMTGQPETLWDPNSV